MKRIIIFSLALIFSLSTLSIHAEVVDRIIVIVNDEIITQGEVDKILVSVYQKFKVQYSGEELNAKIDEARTNLLETLISDRLLLSEARRKKIEVEDEREQ